MGGGLPAKIWREVMLAAHQDVQPEPLPTWTRPEAIEQVVARREDVPLRNGVAPRKELALAPQAQPREASNPLADLFNSLW